MSGRVIEIEKPYFGIDKNQKITYNKDEVIGGYDFYYTEYATLSQFKDLLMSGYTIFMYLNPDNDYGLWNHICSETDSFKGGLGSGIPKRYDYRIVCLNVKSIINEPREN